MRIQVKDFMSTPVITVIEESSLSEVKSLMKQKGIHAIPVVKYIRKLPKMEVAIKGIVTMTDLSVNLDDKTPITDVMTQSVHIIHLNSSAQATAKMMLKHKVHHLVVMDEGEVVGMISSLDFVKLVADYSLK